MALKVFVWYQRRCALVSYEPEICLCTRVYPVISILLIKVLFMASNFKSTLV